MSPRPSIFLLFMVSLGGTLSLAAQQLNEKAARVLQPLLKRPGSEALFERFVGAWLDTGTMEELEVWLVKRATEDPVAPNRLLLALWLSRKGETINALEQIRTALASAPGSPEIWYQKALLESRTLDFEAAITSLNECLARNPAGELPLQSSQLLGRLQARAGRTDEAIRTWDALLKSRPGDDDLREDILELQIAENLWPAARETAQGLVAATADPYRRVLRRMRLGDVLDRSGQRDRALETFTACLADTGAGSWLEKEILSQIEKLFRREDDLSGLRTYFDGLLETHSHRAGLQRARARLLMEAGETETAVACGRALLALSPGDRAAREEFIALLTGAGHAAEAVAQVEQLLAQSPDDLELLLSLAALKHAAHDTPGALAALRDYEKKAGGRDGTAIRVAGLMDRYGATNEAVKTLRADLERAEQPEARQMLASLLHKSDRKDEALVEWKRLAAEGGLPQVQQAARAMQAHGETAAAWDVMSSAAAKADHDPVFLTYLCTLADEPERALAALPSARRLVELARPASDLNNAVDVALRVVRLSGRTAEVTAELAQSASTAQALCFLAALRESGRDSLGADEALEKARAVSPELAGAQLVRLWSVRGDFGRAAAAAESLFNSPGGRQGQIAEMLASLNLRAGSADGALRWTQEWRQLVPGSVAAVLAEARLLESLGRESEAITALRSAAGRFEGNEDIRARLASLSLDAGRSAEALRLFSALYEDAPDLSAKMRWLGAWGEAAQKSGQLPGLIERFEDRRRENRGSVAPLMALAELHRIADNYDARRNALTEAARLKPDDAEIALEIARLEARENDSDSAIRTLQPMLTKDQTGRVAALLADLLINTGRLDEGIRLLTERTAASPAAVELAALALARRDEEATALHFLRPHLEKYPDDGRLHFLAALIEWRTGASDAAVAHLVPLVDAEGPLPRAGAGTSPAGLTYDEMVLRLMPHDVRQCFRLLLESGKLTAVSSSQWGQSRQSPYTSLPLNLEELRDRSAALVLEIAKSDSREKQSAWVAELNRRGCSSAGLLLELPPMRGVRPADRSFDFTALLKQHPDNRMVLAVAALSSGYRRWSEPADAALAEKAWAAFKADALPAAVYLALPGAGRSEPPAAWERELLDAAERMDHPPALLAMAAARSAGFNAGNDETGEGSLAPEAWQKRIVALLLRWRADASVGSGNSMAAGIRGAVFQMLARDCLRRHDASALAELLDSEWRTQPAGAFAAASGGSDVLAAPLGFPPWFLPGMPDGIRQVLRSSVTSDMAAQTAALVQEPVLRVILAGRAGGDAAEKAMQAMPDAAAASAVPLILTAAWQEKRGDFAAAAEVAGKALYLPLSQEARRRLDGALAYWASKKGKPGDALLAAGREAALRLRRDATTEEFRAELAVLMDKLGLTDEADRLMRQGKAAAAARAASPEERLERLLDEGKSKEALPSLISTLRGWARQRLNAGGEPSRDSQMKWRTRVQANGLLPQVMEALLPPRATPQQIAEFAAACDLLGELDRARLHYEQALAAGVKKKVPQLLMSILVRRDEEEAVTLVRKYPELLAAEALREWLHRLISGGDRSSDIGQLLAAARFFERLHQALPASELGRDFPAATVLEAVGGEAWAGDLHSLSEVDEGNKLELHGPEPSAAETARVQALADERLAAYVRLARAYLDIPAAENEVWYALEKAWTLSGKPPEELLALQIRLLLREMAPENPGTKTATPPSDLSVRLNGMLHRAVKLGRLDDISKTIVPAVQRTHAPEAAERLLRVWELFAVPGDQFSAAARRLVEKHGPETWSMVIGVAHARSTGDHLAEELLAYFSRTDRPAAEFQDNLFGSWCLALERMEGRAAAEQFVRSVLRELLGPAEDSRREWNDSKSPPLVCAMRLMAELSRDDAWTGYVMRWMRDEIVPRATVEVEAAMTGYFGEQSVSEPLFRLIGKDKLAEAKTFLDSLPLTEEPAAFYAVSTEVIEFAARALQNLSEKELGALGLGGDQSLTFGRRVLRGVATGWMNGLCHELAGWEDRLAELPDPQGSRIREQFIGLRGWLATDAAPKARAFHSWLFKDQFAEQREKLEQDLARFLRKAGAESFESGEVLVDELGDLLAVMKESAHPRGREVMAAARRGLAAMDQPQEGSLLLELLREEMSDYREMSSGPELPWLLGLMAGALLDGEPPSTVWEENMSGIGGPLLHSEDTSVEGRLSSCMERLTPFLRPGEARLLMIPAMENLARQYAWNDAEKRYAEGLKWAELQRGKCDSEELRLEMEMALRFHLSSYGESHPQSGGEESSLPVEQRHYLAQLRDVNLSMPLRLSLGAALLDSSSLFDNHNGALQPVLVHEVARLLKDSLTDRLPVTPAQEAGIFSALALLPAEMRDNALVKSLLPLTSLPRLREETDDYSIAAGLLAVLDLALRAGDTGTADRLLEMEGRFPGQGALAMLARHGQKQRLADLLKSRPEVLQNSDDTILFDQWDAALQSQLPGVLEGIPDPVQRYEVLVCLTLFPDPDPLPPDLKPRDVRLQELAKSFAAVPWKGLAARDRVLGRFLSWHDAVPEELMPVIVESASRVPLAAVPCMDNDRGENWTGFSAVTLSRALVAGDSEPLLEAFRSLQKLPRADFNVLSGIAGALFDLQHTEVLRRWPFLTPEVRSRICAAWRRVAGECGAAGFRSVWLEQLQFVLLLHALDGRMEELRTWQNELPETQRLLMHHSARELTPEGFLDEFRHSLEEMSGTPEEKHSRRLAVLSALALNPIGTARGVQFEEDFLSIEGATPEEFLTLETTLTAAHPDDGWLAAAFARVHAAQGAWDKALFRCNAALTKMKPERGTSYVPLLELRVQALEHTGRGEEALPEILALAELPGSGKYGPGPLKARAAEVRLLRRIAGLPPSGK